MNEKFLASLDGHASNAPQLQVNMSCIEESDFDAFAWWW